MCLFLSQITKEKKYYFSVAKDLGSNTTMTYQEEIVLGSFGLKEQNVGSYLVSHHHMA